MEESKINLGKGNIIVCTKSRNVYEGLFKGRGELDGRPFLVIEDSDEKALKIVFVDSIEAIETSGG